MPYIIDPVTKKRIDIDPNTGQPVRTSAPVTSSSPNGMAVDNTNNFQQPTPAPEKPSLLGFGANLFKSGINTVKDIGGAAINVFNPNMEKNTLANLTRLAVGTGELAIPGEQGAEKYARAVGQFYDERYGISNLLKGDLAGAGAKAGNTLYNDPVGAALDASILFSGGAGAVGKAGQLTKSATLTKTAGILSKAAEVTNPLTFASGAVAKLGTGEKVAGAGKAVETAGTKYGIKAIKPAPGDISSFLDNVGTALDTFQQTHQLYGTTGQILDKTKALIKTTQTAYNKLVRTGKTVDVKGYTKMLRDKAAEMKKGSIAPETHQIADALIERAKFMEAKAGKTGQVAVDAITEAKGASYSNLSPGKISDAAFQNASKEAGRLGIIYLDSVASGSSALGKTLQGLQTFKDIVEKRAGKGEGVNPLTLTNLATGTAGAAAGGALGGIPGSLAGAAGAEALKGVITSPAGISATSKGMQTAGKVIQKVPAVTSKVGGVIIPPATVATRLNPTFANGQEAAPSATPADQTAGASTNVTGAQPTTKAPNDYVGPNETVKSTSANPLKGWKINGKPIDASTAQLIKGIADYRIDITKVTSLRTADRQRLAGLVAQYDPTYDQTQFTSRSKQRADYNSGKAATSIRSLNTAVTHLQELADAGAKLNNTNLQFYNQTKNAFKEQTGSKAVTNFDKAVNAVAGEMATVFKGSSGTDQEIATWKKTINSKQSPDQIQSGIEELIKLMAGRLSAFNSQWESGMGKPKDFHILSQKSVGILSKMGIDPNVIDPVATP